jgi:glycerate-2-kinase
MRKFATIAAVVALATSQMSMAAPSKQTTRVGTVQASTPVPNQRSNLAGPSILLALAGLAAAGLAIAVASGGGGDGDGGTRPTSP